jgi:hypothetical protein
MARRRKVEFEDEEVSPVELAEEVPVPAKEERPARSLEVTLTVPVRIVARPWRTTHVRVGRYEARLSEPQGKALDAVCTALEEAGASAGLPRGRVAPVRSKADALRWLLERVAEAISAG